MKENEFLDGVSNIEPDVVERFVTMDNKLQSRSKRSRNIWIRVLALAACVALVIGVIATVVLLQGGETGQTIPEEPSLNERIFLNVAVEGEDANNGFADSATAGVYTKKTEDFFEEMAESIKKLPFDNDKEFKYHESECAYKTSDSQEYGTFYSIYDVYKCGKEEVAYLHGTDLLCFYSASNANIDGITSPVQSNEAAKSAADTFLLTFLSQAELDKFNEISLENSNYVFPYTVTYTRVIEGYKTDEELWVFFDADGNFRGYNGYNLNKYDNLLDKISKEKIDAAKAALMQNISANVKKAFSYEEPRLTTDTSGNVYLEMEYMYTNDEGMEQIEIALVSVN